MLYFMGTEIDNNGLPMKDRKNTLIGVHENLFDILRNYGKQAVFDWFNCVVAVTLLCFLAFHGEVYNFPVGRWIKFLVYFLALGMMMFRMMEINRKNTDISKFHIKTLVLGEILGVAITSISWKYILLFSVEGFVIYAIGTYVSVLVLCMLCSFFRNKELEVAIRYGK